MARVLRQRQRCRTVPSTDCPAERSAERPPRRPRRFLAQVRPPLLRQPSPPPLPPRTTTPSVAAPTCQAWPCQAVVDEEPGTAHQGRRRGDRRQHGAQPGGADGDELPQRPGQAARGQPQRHQRLPHAVRQGQGQLHPLHRLRHRPGDHRRRAGDAQQLHHRRRRQGSTRRQRHGQHGPRRRCRQG